MHLIGRCILWWSGFLSYNRHHAIGGVITVFRLSRCHTPAMMLVLLFSNLCSVHKRSTDYSDPMVACSASPGGQTTRAQPTFLVA